MSTLLPHQHSLKFYLCICLLYKTYVLYLFNCFIVQTVFFFLALQGYVSPLFLSSSALSGFMCIASLHVLYRRFQASLWGFFSISCLPLTALQSHLNFKLRSSGSSTKGLNSKLWTIIRTAYKLSDSVLLKLDCSTGKRKAKASITISWRMQTRLFIFRPHWGFCMF